MMTRAELSAAIERVIDAERTYAQTALNSSTVSRHLEARREVRDARDDLDALLGLLDHELAFTPPDSCQGRSQV